MMKLLTLAAVFFSQVAVASPALDADGVPKVDLHGTIVTTSDAKALAAAQKWGTSVPRVRMISVDGMQVPLGEFLLSYCQGKHTNETCLRGSKIRSIDSSSGPKQQLPKGL